MYIRTLKQNIIIWLVLFTVSLYPTTIDINQQNISLLESSSIYLDDSTLSLEDIIHQQLFTPYMKSSVNIGPSKKTVWVKLSFKNNSLERIEKILLIYSIFLEHISFYTEDNLTHPIQKGQAHFSTEQNTILDYFALSLNTQETKTVYFKVSSHYVPLRFTLNLEEEEAYLLHEDIEKAIDIFLIGFILALMLYSLLLAVYIKDKSYLYYSFYLFILVYDQSRFIGISHLYYSEPLMLFDLQITIVRVYLLVIGSSLFTIHFLQIKSYPRLYKAYISFIAASSFALFFLDMSQALAMNMAFILILCITIYNLFVGIYTYKKGLKQARLYILGFSIVFVSFIFIILDVAGVISMTQYFSNVLLFSTALEALILSLAFADRYIILQKEKEKINTQYLSESKNREILIEAEVKQKTLQLNEALQTKELLLQEVHHRVKNNLHIILSMVQLQQTNHRTKIESTLLIDLENRINAIAKTYDMLILNNDLEQIDMKQYITHIVDDIQESFTYMSYDVDCSLSIDAKLPIKEAIYVGLIINEIITNSYKYAFTDKKGQITLQLQGSKEYTLKITDDGCGFSAEDYPSSLGLNLIHTLVTEQLQGTILREKKQGTYYTITFNI